MSGSGIVIVFMAAPVEYRGCLMATADSGDPPLKKYVLRLAS
jgi:hypothetical protein